MCFSYDIINNETKISPNPEINPAFEELEQSVKSALETYSNVHRGTGHFSMITTELFERAREIVLDYFELGKKEYVVIFCTAYGSEILKKQIQSQKYHEVSSRDIGLPLGLRALAIRKRDLPKGIPFNTGGSVVKMVSPGSVIWADEPQKFEAGTPSIINAITFAIALMVKKKYGADCFKSHDNELPSAEEIFNRDELIEYSGKTLLEELRKLYVGRDVLVPTSEGEKPFINLDNAASTPTFLPIWNVVRKVWRQSETMQTDIVREVKKILAAFLNASSEKYDTIFTCNTTEAINIAARFIQNEFNDDSGIVILNTLLEHNSNELPWRYIPGASVIRLAVDDGGFVNPEELELILKKYNVEASSGKKRIRLVAISGGSNVLGTFNDLETISMIVHKYDARLLVDGAQVVAHRSINMEKLGIDYFAFSGHKVYAPFGSGALIVKKKFINIAQSDFEKIKASGEENIAGVAALGKAIILLQRIGMDIIEEREKVLVHRLLQGLTGIRGIEIFGIKNPVSKRLHHKGGIFSFRLNRVPHNLVANELAEHGGIGVRNGCFCAHLLVKHLLRIHPARAFGANISLKLTPHLTSIILPGLVRVSLGLENDENDIERLITALEKIAAAPRSFINRLLAFTGNGTLFLSHTNTHEQIKEFFEARIQKVYSSCSDYFSKKRK